MSKYLIINGPNLNLLGKRNTAIYGDMTLAEIRSFTEKKLGSDVTLEWFQSNIEGEITQKIQEVLAGAYDGLVINPGAYAHTSICIYDALECLNIPVVEVHLSNVYKRKSFRQTMLTAGAVTMIMCGLGKDAYYLAIHALRQKEPICSGHQTSEKT